MASGATPALEEPRLECVATLTGHTDRVWHASWHPVHPLLATASADRSVRIWRPRRGGGDGASETLSSSKWTCVATVEDFTNRTVRSVEWSPDGRYLACSAFDGKSYVWGLTLNTSQFDESTSLDSESALHLELIATLEGHENEVKSCAWSPGGNLLATCGRDKSVWLWGMDEEEGDMEVVAVLHGHTQDVKCVSWHPTRDLLFSASYDDSIKVWGECDGDWVCIDTLMGHTSTVWSIALDKSGQWLASGSDDCSVVLWAGAVPIENPHSIPDILVYRKAATLEGLHTRTVFSVGWGLGKRKGMDTDLPLLASTGADDSVRVYAPTGALTGSTTTTATTTTAVVDASRVAGDGGCRDESSGQDDVAAATCTGTTGTGGVGACPFTQIAVVERAHAMDINCVRWHHTDGTLLATTSDDTTVKLWRLRL